MVVSLVTLMDFMHDSFNELLRRKTKILYTKKVGDDEGDLDGE